MVAELTVFKGLALFSQLSWALLPAFLSKQARSWLLNYFFGTVLMAQIKEDEILQFQCQVIYKKRLLLEQLGQIISSLLFALGI